MASPGDIKSLSRMQVSQAANTDIIPKLPPYPEALKKRFQEMYQHERDMEAWRIKANIALRGGVT